MLKTILLGNLTADPKTIPTQNGGEMVTFTVAHNERTRDGESRAVFVDCVAFKAREGQRRDLGGTIERFFRKGDTIYVEGNISARSYTTRDGKPGASLNLTVTDFAFCGKTSGNAPAANTAPALTRVEADDTLPF